METSESHVVPAGNTSQGTELQMESRVGGTSYSTLYSDRVQAELLNLQSETELLIAQLQALSRSQPASVG